MDNATIVVQFKYWWISRCGNHKFMGVFGSNKGYFKTISFCLWAWTVLLLQALPFGIWWFGALQILIGSFIVGVNPSLSAAVTLNTDPAFRGRMFGMTTTAQQFGEYDWTGVCQRSEYVYGHCLRVQYHRVIDVVSFL